MKNIIYKLIAHINNCHLAFVIGSQPLVVVEQVGRVRLIGINRPEKRNCVNILTAVELTKAFHDFESDENSLVAVLHGKGIECYM